MKLTLSLIILSLTAVLSTPVSEGRKYKIADKDFLEKQYKVLSLFKHIQQPSYFDEHVQINQRIHDPIHWLQLYKASSEKPEIPDTLIKFFEYEYMLPKGTPFSVMYQEHLEQATQLFKLFYYAKDFQTFYETAAVMGKYVNEGMFLYSVSVAIVHRPDCYGIILPPIYEVYPWYFFNTDVIQEAYKYKMVKGDLSSQKSNIIYANYSGHYLNLNPEQYLSYYLEDVGISAFHYYYSIYYPSWMNGEEFYIKNDRRGEFYLSFYQGLAARYYLERLSHGYGETPNLDWEVPFETSYYPSLQYPNGFPFPERPKFADLPTYLDFYGKQISLKYAYSHSFVQDFEQRMRDVIDSGVVLNLKNKSMVNIYEEKGPTNNFGNLLQGNPDSFNPKYYGKFVRFISHLMSYTYVPRSWREVAPSAMQHAETCMRDPAFYIVNKKILSLYQKFQNHMKSYQKKELVFPGVTIKKVEMDRLVTYFDQFYSDLSNVVWDSVEELKDDKFQVWAVQQRLNHKPFTYKIYVNSDQDTEAVVKVFLGPKYDEYGRFINISENRWNFVPIDVFQWHLKSGENIIKRSSQESKMYGRDRTSFHELFKKVTEAYKGQGEFLIDGQENYFYFPDRFMLPMGSDSGLPYQFYFMVYPYKADGGQKKEMTYFYPRPGTGAAFIDDKSIYYPFDRPIKFEKMFTTEVPNSYFYETKIYLRNVDEAQVSQ